MTVTLRNLLQSSMRQWQIGNFTRCDEPATFDAGSTHGKSTLWAAARPHATVRASTGRTVTGAPLHDTPVPGTVTIVNRTFRKRQKDQQHAGCNACRRRRD